MIDQMEQILLFSGGLDSLIAWYYLDKPVCLYVPLGHRYQTQEERAIQNIKNTVQYMGDTMKVLTHTGINLGVFEDNEANIPARNMFLATLGAEYANKVYMVFQQGERGIPDRSDAFLKKSSAMLSLLFGHNKEVDSPFEDKTKVDMVRWFVETMGIEDAGKLIRASWSCYSFGDTHCGRCSACIRRFISLKCNGLGEIYETHPASSSLGDVYRKRAASGGIHKKRASEIIEALGDERG